MDLILTLLPPIAAVFVFIYMRQQRKAAQEHNESLFPDLKERHGQTPTSSPRQGVYFLGIFEFAINAIEKFILPNPNGSKERQIQNLINSARQRGDLKGKLAVITGGDSGIGCELAKALIECGMNVIISGRSERALQQAEGRIRSALNVGHDRLKHIILELSSFEKVEEFTKAVGENLDSRGIDILVNNAGVMNCPFEKTKNHLEYQSQVNCFATILTTLYLLPLMSPKSRIITTSSSTLYATNHIDISKFSSRYRLDGLGAYAQSKLSLALLTKYLSERVQTLNPGVTINSCHPGIVNTPLFQYSTVFSLAIFHPNIDSVSGEFWLNQLPRPLGSITMGSRQEVEESQTATIQRWLWQISLDFWGISEDKVDKFISLCRKADCDTDDEVVI
ncbi:unnamed protein product [Umbelopsis sp. WA50703]